MKASAISATAPLRLDIAAWYDGSPAGCAIDEIGW
jgi:hypothetical protein